MDALKTVSCSVLGVDVSASGPALDLVYVRSKLSGGGSIVQLLTAVAQSSTSVKLTWKVPPLTTNIINTISMKYRSPRFETLT